MKQKPLTFKIGPETSRVIFFENTPEDREKVFGVEPSIKSLWVCDENVRPLLPQNLGAVLHVIKPGEELKTLETLKGILTAALEAGLARDSVFYALGGGVVCDLTALAASLYMRGAGLVLIPTTLLAMVDAGLGGKTGADLQNFKNIAGTFYPANEIRICSEFLSSLPQREYLSGLAELIKHAFLKRSSLLQELRDNQAAVLARDPAFLNRALRQSLLIKGRYVEKDFKERSVRAHLNFGHTFAHALETYAGLKGFSHGEAVAWGMARALETGRLLSLTDPAYEKTAHALLESYGFDLSLPPGLDPPKFQGLMESDKKKKSGRLRFVLQRDWGRTFLSEVPAEILVRVLKGV
jgi:3-dehydroquinate synthase